MVYNSTTINQSPTISLMAAEELKDARGKAVVVSEGKVKLAKAGENAIGIVMLSDDENIPADARVNVQIKDIGAWVAGGQIAVGDELTSDANGCAVKATDDNFITGIAITAATGAGAIVRVQIVKAGYKPAAE